MRSARDGCGRRASGWRSLTKTWTVASNRGWKLARYRLKSLLQNAGVKVVQIEDADVAAKCADAIDDLRVVVVLAHDELELLSRQRSTTLTKASTEKA